MFKRFFHINGKFESRLAVCFKGFYSKNQVVTKLPIADVLFFGFFRLNIKFYYDGVALVFDVDALNFPNPVLPTGFAAYHGHAFVEAWDGVEKPFRPKHEVIVGLL